MNENGRNVDFLVEEETYTDPRTGVIVTSPNKFTVWADKGMDKVIEQVEGVSWVFHDMFDQTEFGVFFRSSV